MSAAGIPPGCQPSPQRVRESPQKPRPALPGSDRPECSSMGSGQCLVRSLRWTTSSTCPAGSSAESSAEPSARSTAEPPLSPTTFAPGRAAFPGDDGLADPSIRRALAAAVGNSEPTAYLGAVAALCQARLLVPVVATRTDSAVTSSGRARRQGSRDGSRAAAGRRRPTGDVGLHRDGRADHLGRQRPTGPGDHRSGRPVRAGRRRRRAADRLRRTPSAGRRRRDPGRTRCRSPSARTGRRQFRLGVPDPTAEPTPSAAGSE